MFNKTLLLATASILAVAHPAEAADYIFGSNGSVPERSWQTRSSGVTQIRLNSGALVSLVGKSRYFIDGERLTIGEGAITIISDDKSDIVIFFESGGSARISGSASLTVRDGAVRGHVLDGTTTLAREGKTNKFSAGSAWTMAVGEQARRVFANPAQQTPDSKRLASVASLKQEGIRGAALNGLPVTLGFALSAIGASGDIQQAARTVDARALEWPPRALPSGDIERLLDYSARLAAALAIVHDGDAQALSPALIEAYLRYLADSGNAAQFQAAYNAILAQYLTLLQQGGSAADFEGADLDSVNAYLAYLQANGQLEQLFASQQDLIAAYLAFLAEGGDPASFVYGDGTIDPELLTAYGNALAAYLAYLADGGAAGSYDVLSAAQIQAYLAALENAGLLDSLFAVQADALRAYLAYLENGGLPGDYDGIDALIPGLSDALAQQYAAALAVYYAYLADGGVPSEYDSLTQQALLAYLQALNDAGLLAGLPDGQGEFLTAYLAWLNDGGSADQFPGLPTTGLSDAQKLAIVDGFLAHIKANGLPSTFTDADFDTVLAYFQDYVSLKLQQDGRAEDNALLNTYFNYVRFGGNPNADEFPGLPALGGSTATYAVAHALNRPNAAVQAATSTGGYTMPLTLDADGAPVYILSDILVQGPTVAERDIGSVTTSTRVYGDRYTYGGQYWALGVDQGLHFATAAPLVNAPANATINYVLDSATSPTFNDGSSAPGTFDAAIAVNYNGLQLRMAAEGSVIMPGDTTYTFTTPGGVAGVLDLPVTTFATSADRMAIQQSAPLVGTGKACVAGATNCNIYLGATPGGDEAEALVLSYASREGGDGSIGFAGSAGFVADTGSGGGGGTGEYVAPDFDASNIVFYSATYAQQGTGSPTLNNPAVSGSATRDDDGAINDVEYLGAVRFRRGDMPVLEQSGTDYVLLTRFGEGSFDYYDTPYQVSEGRTFDMVAISNPNTILPTGGTVTYALTGGYAPQTTNGLTNASFDMTMAVAFGYTPRVAVEGTLSLDTTYEFSTPGGLAAVVTQGATMGSYAFAPFASVTSGTGDFCTAGNSCLVRVVGQFTDDFAQAGGYFTTTGGAERASGVFSLAASELNNLSFTAGAGAASGSLTNPYSGTGLLPVIVHGGGNNIRGNYVSTNALFIPVFDDRGLVSLTYDATNPTREGDIMLDRNTMQVADLAGDSEWQIGRFHGGMLEGTGTNTLYSTIFGADNGVHYALIPALANLPATGTINYALKAATRPTYSNEATAPGTFTGDMAVKFGTSNLVGVAGTVAMPDATYSFETAGGIANPSVSTFLSPDGNAMLTFNSTVSNTAVSTAGAACDGTTLCNTRLQGQIGGEGAGWATLGYIIYNEQASEWATIAGASVFEGGTLIPDAPPLDGTERADQITTYSSSVIGIDQRQPTTVTYDNTTGAPIAYSFAPPNEEPTIGSASLHEAGSVTDVIGWARWAGGTTGGKYYNLPTADLPTNGGWHIVSGTPATNLPASGTATYSMVGSTAPTMRDGSIAPGSVTGSAAVAFGSIPHVGVDLNVTIGGSTYGIATNGGAANPASGMAVGVAGDQNHMVFRDYNLVATVESGSGSVCGGQGDCGADITGFLAGDGASHIGLNYTFGNMGFDKQVDGGIVFGKN
ncbi:hypothetical protein [Croceicoccus naphthovorans]|uniref:Uncharacterized protein n=1 Tax=Croceicoccus naphthovorans TaxID=1348774 RepID=A0A0G3XD64_9SPHN|nr:hypothetical protein [Croceicoccus naphthovorans]AKM09107.1 hypothetical protein AB433_02610 [Croceicoccus naphthovorans]MBB3991648.1 hypothetical protein [Croceicoccus naphthovorans]